MSKLMKILDDPLWVDLANREKATQLIRSVHVQYGGSLSEPIELNELDVYIKETLAEWAGRLGEVIRCFESI